MRKLTLQDATKKLKEMYPNENLECIEYDESIEKVLIEEGII